MIIVDEVYQNVVYHLTSEEIKDLIERLKVRKEEEIEGIKSKINKYEQKGGQKRQCTNPSPPSGNGLQGIRRAITQP